jgi:hypothetical protein
MSRRSTFIAIALILLSALPTFGATTRSYVAGNFFLEIEGVNAGFVSGVDGGFAFGNVVEEFENPDYFVKKHLEDPPEYGDISLEMGSGMSPALYQWFKDVLEGGVDTEKDGAIIAVNYNNQVVRRLDFVNAQITRLTFPALNAASKDAATIKLTLSPQSTVLSSPGGTFKATQSKSAKKWQASNFRLSIKGLDTAKVSAVDAIDIVIPRAESRDGFCENCPKPKINYPDLDITVSEANAATWFAWHQSFVIAGQNDDADEKTGTLDYLDPTLKTVLFSLNLTGLGITSVANQPAEAGLEGVARVKASMYSERITLSLFPGN